MIEHEEGGRQEGPAQSDKNTGPAQPGTYQEMEQAGKKSRTPDDDTGDSDAEMDQTKKGGQQGGNIRQ